MSSAKSHEGLQKDTRKWKESYWHSSGAQCYGFLCLCGVLALTRNFILFLNVSHTLLGNKQSWPGIRGILSHPATPSPFGCSCWLCCSCCFHLWRLGCSPKCSCSRLIRTSLKAQNPFPCSCWLVVCLMRHGNEHFTDQSTFHDRSLPRYVSLIKIFFRRCTIEVCFQWHLNKADTTQFLWLWSTGFEIRKTHLSNWQDKKAMWGLFRWVSCWEVQITC